MGSCERKPAGRLVSSRPLWSDSRISVQAWQNPMNDDGTPIDPIRVSFSVDGASWFLPWSRFIALVNEGNITVGRNLTGNRFGGNQLVVRYRQCHRLQVEPLIFCSGHDHEIVFGQVQVVEIIAKVNEARDEWARIFGGEFGGLPVPRLAFQTLVTEALRARGALGSSLPEDEDPSARRDDLFDACGGPDQDPEPLDIEPSLGKKEPYDDESGDGGVGTGNPPDGGEHGTRNPSRGSTDSADESAARLRQRLIDRGLIKPLVEEPRVAQQTDTPDDVS